MTHSDDSHLSFTVLGVVLTFINDSRQLFNRKEDMNITVFFGQYLIIQ